MIRPLTREFAFLLLLHLGVLQDPEGLPNWRADQVWEVGDLAGPLSFTSVSDLVAGPDGRAYVAQPQLHEVWVIDSTGSLAGVIGRQGGGPGEFRHPRSLFWRGNTLAVYGSQANRVSLFSADGVLLPSFPTPPLVAGLGLLGAHGLVTVHAEISSRLASGQVTSQALRLQNALTGQLDTLAHLDSRHKLYSLKGERLTSYGPEPFSDDPIWRGSADGNCLVIVRRSVEDLSQPPTFTVEVFEGEGGSRYIRSIPFQPLPLDRGRVDAVAQAKSREIRGGLEAQGAPLSPQDFTPEALRDAWYLPRVHPPVEDLALPLNGEIWLRRETRAGIDTVPWLVLGPEGEPRATVALPSDLEIGFPGNHFVYGVRKDDLDVYHLVRFRLVKEGALDRPHGIDVGR